IEPTLLLIPPDKVESVRAVRFVDGPRVRRKGDAHFVAAPKSRKSLRRPKPVEVAVDMIDPDDGRNRGRVDRPDEIEKHRPALARKGTPSIISDDELRLEAVLPARHILDDSPGKPDALAREGVVIAHARRASTSGHEQNQRCNAGNHDVRQNDAACRSMSF